MECILHAPPRTSLVVNCVGVVRGLDPTFYGVILWNLVTSPVLLHMCVFCILLPYASTSCCSQGCCILYYFITRVLAGVLTVPLWGPYSDARISCIIMVYSAVCRILPFLDSILPRYYFGGIIHRWVSNGLTRLESH